MSARRFGTQSLVRLLGNWQETSSLTPLWRQLAEALRLLILDGRLTLQTRLPGERELAAALNVSRTTIASALGQLREEGFLYSRQGSGSRIVLPERPADLPLPAGISSTLNLSTAALSAGPEVHQAFQHAMTLLPPYLAQTGYDQQGLPVLREAIARRYSERGLPTRPDEVMVVNGALSAYLPGRAIGWLLTLQPIRWPSAPFRAPPAAPSGSRFRSRDGTAMDWRRLLRRLRRGWRG